jgi:hypothetical protein
MRFVSHARLVAACAAVLAGCSPPSATRVGVDAGEADAVTDDLAPDGAGEKAPADVAADLTISAHEAGSDGPGEAAAADALGTISGDAPSTGPAWLGPSSLIVAVGNDGRRMVSTDANTWTGEIKDASGNRDGPKALRAVAYGNHTVVAVGGGCTPVCTSRILTYDGKTWTEITDFPPNQGRLNGVVYAGGSVWVAVGVNTPSGSSSGPTVGTAIRSTDNGKTWTATGRMAMITGLRAVSFGRVGDVDMFVAVGDGYGRARSLDGITWTDLKPSDGSSDSYKAVAIGNGVAVAVGGRSGAGRRVRSIDGATWTDEIPNMGPDLLGVLFVDNRFMAFSGSGDDTVHLSPDGKAWETHVTVNAGACVASGLLGSTRIYISRVSPSSIRISIDGLIWTQRAASLQGDAQINAFTFAGY